MQAWSKMTDSRRLRGAAASGSARLQRLPPWGFDTALAVVLTCVEISVLWVLDPQTLGLPGFTGPTPLGVGVIAVGTLPLALRRRWPELVLVIAGVTSILAIPLGVPLQGFAVLAALYTVAAYCDRVTSYSALGIFAVGNLIALILADSLRLATLNAVVFITAWALGDRTKARRLHATELERRATQLEREREDRTRLAVAGERARIARELHDVIAHSMTVMVVQTSGARRTFAKDPAKADAALAEVEATGRRSLAEMRRLLEILRDGDAPQMAPQPGLHRLQELVEQFRGTGMTVRFRVEGEQRALPASVDLSAYRIVQESLTNVLKHAGAATASVLLRYRDDELAIEVLDDGHGLDSPNGQGRGHGLIGIRERASLVGGRAESGPCPDGGFAVRATLPTGEPQ